jgi:hypothetical protein
MQLRSALHKMRARGPADWSHCPRFVRAATHVGVVIRELNQNRELA